MNTFCVWPTLLCVQGEKEEVTVHISNMSWMISLCVHVSKHNKADWRIKELKVIVIYKNAANMYSARGAWSNF